MTANVERGTNEKHRDLMSEGRKLDWELFMRSLAIVAAWFGAKRARGFAKRKKDATSPLRGAEVEAMALISRRGASHAVWTAAMSGFD
ncbi:hypothetical protein PQQ87_12370 [Paraburkholderia nemoris]|uniref:hypothetical protein n=1 Tax=Paraburkholderia nemoris TaxID=2793076 RepID=UPI0038BD62BB